jgi:DnaJ-class molecular chaperone
MGLDEEYEPASEARNHGPKLGAAEQQALRVLELKPGVTWDEVKARYKGLAKQLHPDANGGDKSAEERLKLVNQAYSTLKHSALF